LEFDPSGLSIPTGGLDFAVTSSVAVGQLPEIGGIIGVKMTGQIELQLVGSVPQEGGEILEGVFSLPIIVGIVDGTLIPSGAVPAGTDIPVSWDYTVVATEGNVSNETVVFSATLPEAGEPLMATYSGDTFADNRNGTGMLSFDGGAVPIGIGTYDMYLALDWENPGFGDTLTIDFGTNSLDINPIPEPLSAMFFWMAAMLGVVVRRRRQGAGQA
jgi:hypothetical protein